MLEHESLLMLPLQALVQLLAVRCFNFKGIRRSLKTELLLFSCFLAGAGMMKILIGIGELLVFGFMVIVPALTVTIYRLGWGEAILLAAAGTCINLTGEFCLRRFIDPPPGYGLTLICLFILVFLVYLYSSANSQEEALEEQKRHNRELVEHIKSIEEMYEEIRNQKHDFTNVLFSIRGYIENGQMSECTSFCDSVLEEYAQHHPNQYLPSLNLVRHAGVKGILRHKLNRAISIGIKVSLNILCPVEFRTIDSPSLCKIIGILLDNAVEAAVESCEKELHIGIDNSPESTSIIISNSYLNKPDLALIGRKGYSTKGAGRGIGLYNVFRILSRNPSFCLETTLQYNMFFQELIITG